MSSNDRRRSTPPAEVEYSPKDGSGDTGTVDASAFEDTLRDVPKELNKTFGPAERPISEGRYSKPLGGK